MAGREREQGRSPVIGRRRLLGTVAGVAAGGIVGAAATRAQIHPGSAGPSPLLLHSPDLEPFVDELPRPAAISGTALSLHAHASRHRFHRDLPAGDCLAYGGKTYLGPLIEAQRGQPLELTYRNEIAAHPFARDMDTSLHGLGEEVRRTAPTSLHLHGGVTPPDSDGHPEHESRYGQGHVYRFPNVHVRVLARQAIDTLAMCLRQPQPPIGIKWTPDPDPYVVGPVRAPEPWEAGWKDTVMCDPNSVTRLAVVFPTADELGFDPDATFPAAVSLGGVDPAGPGAGAPDHAPLGETVDRLGGDYVGSVAPPAAHHRRSTLQGYVWHCHILDHEDHDMKLRYRLVP